MRYIESPSTDAYFNMALEEYVFEAMPKDDEYFMLWQNKNAIVVGKYQNTMQEINAEYVKEHDIAVVRRLSGGGAMYQDMGNLNFTFVVDQNADKSLDFDVFIRPVVKALGQMGVTAEQSSRNDIVIDGKKFSGNSQYNKGGRTMHHGTLLFGADLSVVGHALRPKADKIQSKGVQSVRSRVTNIRDALPRPLRLDEFKTILLAQMFEANKLEPYILSEEDLRAVQALRDEKYATWDWNYGRSPACNVTKERRYPFGGVTLLLDVDGGSVRSVRFEGDFFGNGDIGELAKKLAGCALREEDVRAVLAGVDVGYYIRGMTAEELAELLLY